MSGLPAGHAQDRRGRTRTGLVAGAVAIVLADSSVVTLGLPAVLRDFRADVADVAWVLTSFNLVLALAALPAAAIVRRGGAVAAWRLGILTFAAASLACALAPSLDALIAARCAQAIGGAAVVASALELLIVQRGPAGGIRVWGAAGIVGAALGPALGGALTELFFWQAIFVVQVPLVVVLALRTLPRGLPAAARGPAPEAGGNRRSGALAPIAALALVSAALTAALFLLVILLTEGLRRSPLEAAGIVSVMPLAALAAAPLARRLGAGLRPAAAGVIALAGGLAALGLLPGAATGWTVAPQILIGIGLGLALFGLTRRALGETEGQAPGAGATLLRRGAWTIAARHAGVVVGLLVLTPVFTSALQDEQLAAQRAGSAKLLDARLSPGLKISLAEALATRIQRSDGRLPDLSPVFSSLEPPPESRRAYARLQTDLTDEVDRAATHAFSTSFLIAAALALLALVPIALSGRALSPAPLLAAAALAAALVGSYVALGGGSYKPLSARDPCQPRTWRHPHGTSEVAEQISLSALDGAACRLRVTREELALALTSADGRVTFLREHRIDDRVLADALRDGLRRAVDDARRAGALSAPAAGFARDAVGVLPLDALISAVRGGKRALDALRGGGDALAILRAAIG
ncbi:MAG: MFS transporter [Solirubrobacteraceae bacterium]